ncbi:MAG: hypothetical protein AAGG50_07555 [Bacteroidota bacterium]
MADLTPTAAPPLQEALGDGAAEAIPTAPEVPASASLTEVPPVTAPTLPPRPRVEEPKGKVARVGDQAKGIVEDTKEWLELRLELAKVEFRDEAKLQARKVKAQAIDQAKKEIIPGAVPAILVAVSALAAALVSVLVLALLVSALLTDRGVAEHWSLYLGFLSAFTLFFLAAVLVHTLSKPIEKVVYRALNKSAHPDDSIS